MKNNVGNEKIDTKKLNETIYLGNKILKILFFLLLIVGIYAITLIFIAWKVVAFMLLILKVLSPFFIGLIIAWLLDPFVKFLHKKGINRVAGTFIVYIVMLIILYLTVTTIFPMLLDQVNGFIKTLPNVFDNITMWLNNLVDRFKNISFIDTNTVKADLISSTNSFVKSLTNDIPSNVVAFFGTIFSALGIFALGLMIGFYLLFDFDNIGKALTSLIPKGARKDALKLFNEANNSLFNYIKGTIFVSIIIFALSSLIFALVGLKEPLLFGLICGLTNIIPYVGPYIGAFPATVVAFTQGIPTGIITLICIGIIQFIEGNFIQPLVMSKTMKLHPVTILIGLLIFGYFFGVLGMIIATPLVAIIKSILLFIESKYEILKFGQGK